MISSRRRSTFTLLAALSALLVGGALHSRLRAQESRETTQIAPGVSMLAVSTQTQNGPLRYWIVKAEKAAAKLALEVADDRDIIKKRSVRDIAAQSGALVAVNGGFFAYEGAAVGAVKVEGEWHRLPWKSRTALMWNEKQAKIAALSGRCQIVLRPLSATYYAPAALNGFSLPGSHTSITDGFAVLTARFAPKYRVATGERALIVRHDMVSELDARGEITMPRDGFVLVARGTARDTLGKLDSPFQLGSRVRFETEITPPALDLFPNILGAGPLLIQDGLVKTTEGEEGFRPDVTARGPRTGVGFDAQGNTLLLVADGRQAASVGLTLPETAQLFQQIGAVQALNLDGGSSTQLVVRGELINAPSGYDPVNPLRAREVRVSNALVLQTP